MNTSELDYELPEELIAQHPAARRDGSRLLVYSRATGEVRHAVFRELPDELPADTLAVLNDTRVVPARIPIESPRGEVLLLERLGGDEWEALARPTRRLRAGRTYGPVELLEHLGEGRWRLRLAGAPAGEVPLPPYIHEPLVGRRPLPDGLRARGGLGRRSDGGPALHARSCSPACRSSV